MEKRYRVLYLVIVLSIIFSSTISLAEVSDIKEHWAEDYIAQLLEKGAMYVYSDGNFRPDNSITRGEFIKAVNNIFEYEELAEIEFLDIDEEDPFYEDIQKAVLAGYIDGYEDNTIRVDGLITRQEASKILSIASKLDEEIYENKIDFKDKDKIGNWALDYVNIMANLEYIEGYDNGEFRPQNNITRAETAKILSLIYKDIFEVEEPEEKPEEKPIVLTKEEQFIKLVDELPNATEITKIVAEEKVKMEQARSIYNGLKPEEEANIPQEKIEKLINIEKKIESLKTPIKTSSKADMRQAQAWAIKSGAHKRFVDVAEFYWAYGELTGINPEILYAQAAKETSYGRYTGQVKPEMNNWAGIKILEPIGDNTYDHEIFETLDDGVRAHFNHMGIYCGVEPIGDPHARWYKTSTASWAGKVNYVEDLGGKWAPNSDYGISIVRDYLNNIYATKTPQEEDISRALEFSNKVENLEEEDEEGLMDALIEYENLRPSEKELVPINIVEELKEKMQIPSTPQS